MANIQGVPFKLNAQDMGGLGGVDLAGSLARGFQLGRMPQQLEQEARARDFANMIAQINAKYAEPQAISGLNLQKAQIGHIGAQTKNLGLENSLIPFRQELLQAQTGSASAKAANDAMKQKFIEQIMRGASGGNSGFPVQPNGAQSPVQASGYQGIAQQPQQQNGINYAQAALASKLMGLGEPKIIDIDGQQTAITPFGSIPVAQGMSPLQKELTKVNAKQYENVANQLSAVDSQSDNLDNLIEMINTQPQLKNVVGPVNSVLANYAGTPEQKDLLGQVLSTSGNITLDAAKSIKGAFTGRDMGLIGSIKPNVKDMFPVFKGKLQAMKLLNEAVKQRMNIVSDLVSQGMPFHQAESVAKQRVSLDALRPEISKLINQAPTFKNQTEFRNYLMSLPLSEREALRSQMLGGQ